MSNQILTVYDNLTRPGERLRDIVGRQRFSDIIYKRRSFFSHTRGLLAKEAFVELSCRLDTEDGLAAWEEKVQSMDAASCFLHLFSYAVVTDADEFSLTLQKLQYSKTNVALMRGGKPLALFFCDTEHYLRFLKNRGEALDAAAVSRLDLEQSPTEALCDISDYASFVGLLSGGFEARYFNTLKGDEFTVTKQSSNKDKIKREYSFYHLLPENMKSWFVLPYNYAETAEGASYTMERYNIADLAICWVHNSVSPEEMEAFLHKAMAFITSRDTRPATAEESVRVKDGLYLHKVEQRIEELKQKPEYAAIGEYVKHGTPYRSIDDLFARYRALYESIGRNASGGQLAIGHGDFCFSNILYDRVTGLMRLVDPKGALSEGELWTDPYYDLAKLSHSICGLYDFFNSGVYSVDIDESMMFRLSVGFDNAAYKALFQKHLAAQGFDYRLTRLYEASLFLSMLPLHIDNPKKVFGFLLNAAAILDEVEGH